MKIRLFIAALMIAGLAEFTGAQTLTRNLVLKPTTSTGTLTFSTTAITSLQSYSIFLPATGASLQGPIVRTSTGLGDKSWTFGQINLGANTATTGDVTGTLAVSNGGTGLTTVAAGSLLVGAGTSPLSVLGAGANGTVLTVVAGTPTWSNVGNLLSAATATYTITGADETAGVATITPAVALAYTAASRIIVTLESTIGMAQAIVVSNKTATTFDVYCGAMTAGDKINYIVIN